MSIIAFRELTKEYDFSLPTDNVPLPNELLQTNPLMLIEKGKQLAGDIEKCSEEERNFRCDQFLNSL